MKIKHIYFILAIAIISAFFIWQRGFTTTLTPENQAEPEKPVIQNKIVEVEITPNSTFGDLMTGAGIHPSIADEIFNAAKPAYDLSNIRVGRKLFLTYKEQTDELIQLVYQIDTEQELYVNKQEQQSNSATTTPETITVWQSKKQPINYEVKIKTVSGQIETSLYQFALDNNVDIRAIIEMADAFQWTIDFAMDPKKGDTFKLIYEERYRGGKYIMPGNILAARFTNEGKDFNVFYFEDSPDNTGYFDENGNSVQKMFLKAPVAFKYISSGFTTGLRYVKAFNVSTGHRAIDYAAEYGVPIRAVGDGTVTSAGWGGAYGNLTTIRHNATYSTNYGHQSRIIVKRGQKVKQGQTIGYVGSTGFSTGPHVHFELVKNGVKVNPLKEILPPGKPIKEENKGLFQQIVEKYQELLK